MQNGHEQLGNMMTQVWKNLFCVCEITLKGKKNFENVSHIYRS